MKRTLELASLRGENTYSKDYKEHREYVALVNAIVNSYLDENDKYIVFNEIILGKTGDWYYECLTPSTYYRHRRKAYVNFLSCLAK